MYACSHTLMVMSIEHVVSWGRVGWQWTPITVSARPHTSRCSRWLRAYLGEPLCTEPPFGCSRPIQIISHPQSIRSTAMWYLVHQEKATSGLQSKPVRLKQKHLSWCKIVRSYVLYMSLPLPLSSSPTTESAAIQWVTGHADVFNYSHYYLK